MQNNNEITFPKRRDFIQDSLDKKFNKLAIFDITGFGNVNHYYGYEFGEKILKLVSSRLEDKFKNGNIYYLGADIFAVTSNENIEKDIFIHAIKSIIWYFGYSPIELDGYRVYIPLRVGVAIDYEELLFTAEYALKQTRVLKHNLVVYDKKEHHICHPNSSNIEQELYWETQIIQAVKKEKFEIFAQLISNQYEKKYEVLVRMKDSKGDIISPFFFLDRAKKINLYSSITKQVIQKSFEFFADKNISFNINLSISDILDKDVFDYLIQKIYEFGVAEFLTIEITESEGIDNLEEVITFINIVKSLGVKIAIDDFGTGYSNFSYLVKLQADFIKLDGSIIQDINRSKSARAVIEAIVFFAKKVGMRTVAEFVSTKEIYDTCKELEIDYFQGYWFDEPKSVKELKII
ncbi:Cyclic di-GMP phosphodiesterase YfgF [Aliarcobacter thereius]|uniref:Cyclic di-GMP phosphodiesterase YfgF n=2 Tax=Aliarcobacter thereius TaxID=544718 RepID=A0A1C0BA70_9BACT|nr:GGDEF domain-containing phosphodiesterase [Aliarcobacter thereius]OCL88368.1 Cyclic di-GMP phosphodiesterase YfgF [Aliarcobacter thereius]OCL91858.1 Cyclic di-GMP phosphodiesterase YfgF [Aliarcobacter thereius]OCL95044.1 Cyclic di-GMP phosphodiesterase YfgF [Aliarcobacter thereius LMG 24486]OCM00496.1 Cyclic di-GMP phosphodiesterase YfgF [Aliarcobacter thereius]QBF16964.1 diguanylate cyclase/phosphodiesterase [Aliarcobacter thereius LMG 24486]